MISLQPALSGGERTYTIVFGSNAPNPGNFDGTEGTLDQYARDVAQFLAWASEPHLEERKRTGVKAFLFLLVFTFVMYGVKKRIWRDAH